MFKPNNIIRIISLILLAFLLFIILIINMYINKIHRWESQEKEAIARLKKNNNSIITDIDDYFIINNNKNNNPNNVIDNNIDSDNNNYKNKNNNSINKDNHNSNNDNGDCIIEIADIDLTKIVYTGKNRDYHLDKYELVTATDDMKYSQGGNYIICGHASKLYGHSLNRLKEVNKGTLIDIWVNNKKDQYIVNKVYFVDMNDTDKYCKQTNQKEITIISCAKYISYNSYIVIKAIPK